MTIDTLLIPPTSTSTNTNTSNSAVSMRQLACGIGAISVAVASVWVIKEAYGWYLQPYKFSPDEMSRYNLLKNDYKMQLGIDYPAYWALTGDERPTFTMDYQSVKISIDNKIEQISSQGQVKFIARASILSLFSRYLESLSKRWDKFDWLTRAHTRDDGVEAMFLSEMISWFLHTVPEEEDVGDKIMDAFEKRIKYCKLIIQHVSHKDWRSGGRDNLKDFLQRLINEMTSYHEHLVNHSKLVNFNKLAGELSDNLLILSMKSLNMLYLLINEAPQNRLNVEQFKNPTKADGKTIKIRETGLGDWLYKDLTLMGINTATFDATEILNVNKINDHLKNQHPDDEICTLKPELRNPLSPQWGHWPFVTTINPPPVVKIKGNTDEPESRRFLGRRKIQKATGLLKVHKDSSYSFWPFGRKPDLIQNQTDVQENYALIQPEAPTAEEKAKKYLESIRLLHKLTPQLYHSRQSMDSSKFVTSVYGQTWIYGSPAGKATLEELLYSVDADVKSYETKYKEFWSDYFEDYKFYAQERNCDAADPCSVRLNQIDNDNKDRQEIIKKIYKLTDDIRANAKQLPEIIEQANQKLMEIYGDVLARMHLYGRTNTPNYKIIAEALKELEQIQANKLGGQVLIEPVVQDGTKNNLPATLQATVLEYKKMHLPNYLRVQQLLFSKKITDMYLVKLVNYSLLDDAKIHPDAMKSIYQNFIRQHYPELDNYLGYLLRMKNRVPYSKRNDFEDIYLRVNAVFHLLYDESTIPKPLEVEIILAEAMIRKALDANFKKHQYFDSYVFKSVPLLTIEEKDSETFVITLDKNWLSLGQGLITEEISRLKTVVAKQDEELKESEQKIGVITGERDEARAEVVVLKSQLQNTENQLVDSQNQLKTVTRERDSLLTRNVQSTAQHRFMKPAVANKGETAINEVLSNNNL
ncbi:MAG: hypothetical protein Q8R83_09975 [Legionellaceae bacterium]|nr:hypothetical protein [Legionellaceae bacterium]